MNDFIRFINLNFYSFFKKKSSFGFLFVYIFVVGFFFFEYINGVNEESVAWNEKIIVPILGNIHFLLVIFIPILTYVNSSLIFNRESKRFCHYLSLSYNEGIFGQFIFCVIVIGFLHLMLLPFVFYLHYLGFKDWRFFLNLFSTLFLISSCLCALSFYLRSKFKNPIIFLCSYIGCFGFLYLIGLAGNFFDNFTLSQLFNFLSFSVIFDSSLSGVFSLEKNFYLGSLIGFFLFLSFQKRTSFENNGVK